MYTVWNLFKRATETGTSLLYNDTAHEWSWWSDYREHSNIYDRLFARHYRSFIYYMQDEGDDIDTVLHDFKTDVRNFLAINAKKYAELYRIEQIADADYSLTNNYDMTESMTRKLTSSGTQSLGARTDSENLGARSDSVSSGAENKVSPYDTNSLYPESATNTTGQSTTGAQSNSSTIGAQSNSTSGTDNETYSLTRKGNIGVMTATDMLDRHNRFWSTWSFLERIFRDLNEDLLLAGESDYLSVSATAQGGGGSFDPSEILSAIADLKTELEDSVETLRDDISDVTTAVNEGDLLVMQSIVATQSNLTREIHDARDTIVDEIVEVSTDGY